MKIPVIDQAIALCEGHLDSTKSWGTDIEAYLTKYLLIFICGCFETEIKNIVVLRASQTKDQEIEEYIKNTIHKLRSFKISDIRGKIVSNFSDRCRTHFDGKVCGMEMEARFDNIVENRHSFAHGKSVNMTFKELVESYHKSHVILDVLIESLSNKTPTNQTIQPSTAPEELP